MTSIAKRESSQRERELASLRFASTTRILDGDATQNGCATPHKFRARLRARSAWLSDSWGRSLLGRSIMTMPVITACYLGVLGLLYAFLGLRVARFRRGNKIVFGDADNLYVRSAIRAHANFAEYVPIIVITSALFEMGRAAGQQMRVMPGRS